MYGMRTQCDEELVVMRVVEVLHQVGEYWEFGENLDDLWCSNELKGAALEMART